MTDIEYTQLLTAATLKIRKYQKRYISNLFSSNAETASVAFSAYSMFTNDRVRWRRLYNKNGELAVHNYEQSVYESASCDAYTLLCDWGAQSVTPPSQSSGTGEHEVAANSYRRIASGMCCYTIELPKELIDAEHNVNNADMNALSFKVFGDKWLSHGCYVSVFFSDIETPPEYSEIKQRIDTHNCEIEGQGFFAGRLGKCSEGVQPAGDKYLRTDVICKASETAEAVSDRDGIVQPLVFMLHDWQIAEPKDGTYNFKKYIHIMLFLTETQYTTDRASWMEGSASVNVDTITLTTTDKIPLPVYTTNLCNINSENITTDNPAFAGAAPKDFQGRIFSLINHFSLSDVQCSELSKTSADICTWNSIESAVQMVNTPVAGYAYGVNPRLRHEGFDFYVVDTQGNERVRIGCVDENAMNISSDRPKPSVYSAVIGYPVNPGIEKKSFSSIIFGSGAHTFSDAITLRVVIYAGRHDGEVKSGLNYGYCPVIDASQFNCIDFYSGRATALKLIDGSSMNVGFVYAGNHTGLSDGEKIVFDGIVSFSSPGAMIIGVCPVDFTQHGTMESGWDETMEAGYNSQYMQLVEWPINGDIKLVNYE